MGLFKSLTIEGLMTRMSSCETGYHQLEDMRREMNWMCELPKSERIMEIQSNEEAVKTLMKKNRKEILKAECRASGMIKGSGMSPGHKAEETFAVTQLIYHVLELFGQMKESVVPVSPSAWFLCKSVMKTRHLLFFLI